MPETARAIAVSAGSEPDGVPAGVVHAGDESRGLLALLDEQVRRHARQRVPAVDEDPEWILCETGAEPLRRRVTEPLFTLGAGGLATRGSVEEAAPGAQPMLLAAGVYDGTGPGQHLALGARGLSGTGYSGHVFWDAEVFMLPAVMAMDPAAGAAMIRRHP